MAHCSSRTLAPKVYFTCPCKALLFVRSVTDPALRRFLVLDSLGQAIRTILFAPSANGLSGRLVSDHLGRVTYSAIAQNPLLARTVGLFRLDIAAGKSDSLASLLGIQLVAVSMLPSNVQQQPFTHYRTNY